MNLFQNVKYGVNCREAAERYGVSVNRQGKALCPFHNDRHPSLYVADDHYYCFACGEHGDVIDFVSRLEAVSPKEAALMLAQAFSVPYEDKELPRHRKPRQENPEQNHSSSWKTSGCALLFCPIMPV